MDNFRTLGSGSFSVTAMLDFSGEANTSIHGIGEDDTVRYDPELYTGQITSLFSFKYEQTDQDIFCVQFTCLAMLNKR